MNLCALLPSLHGSGWQKCLMWLWHLYPPEGQAQQPTLMKLPHDTQQMSFVSTEHPRGRSLPIFPSRKRHEATAWQTTLPWANLWFSLGLNMETFGIMLSTQCNNIYNKGKVVFRLSVQLSSITAIVWLCYPIRQLQLSEYTCWWENRIIGQSMSYLGMIGGATHFT